MNAKSTIVLVAACAGLAYFGLQGPSKQQRKTTVLETAPFEQLDLNGITNIEIASGTSRIDIAKQGEQWRAKSGELDFPVDFSKLREALMDLQKTEILSHVSKNDKIDNRFGLDDSSSPTLVTLKNGDKTLAKLELGKGRASKAPQSPSPFGGMGMGGREVGQFLRISNRAKDVFFAKEKLDVSTSPSTWIKSSLAKADKDEITEISLGYPDKDVILSKEVQTIEKSTDASSDGNTPPETVTTWKLSGSLALETDSSAITSFLDQLDNITVSAPVAATKASQFKAEHSFKLKVSRGDNALYDLSFSKVDPNWYVWSNDTPKEIYKISSYNVENIFANNQKNFSLPEVSVAGNLQSLQWQDLRLKREGDNWNLLGKAPLPEVDQDKAKAVATALAELKATDVFVDKQQWGKAKNSIKVSDGNTETILEKMGTGLLKNAVVLRKNGSLFSVSSSDGDKIFPNIEDILKLESSIDELDGLNAIENGQVNIRLKDDVWTLADGKEANKNSLESWIDSWKSVFESSYFPDGKTFETELTLKAEIKGGLHVSLEVSQAKAGYCWVRASNYGGCFKVKKELIQSLQNGADFFSEKSE
jgi:hypothetical protein